MDTMTAAPPYVRPLGYMSPDTDEPDARAEFVWPDDEPFNPDCEDDDATQGE